MSDNHPSAKADGNTQRNFFILFRQLKLPILLLKLTAIPEGTSSPFLITI
jgi:hypothetical protein